MKAQPDVCVVCEHPIGQHFRSIDSKVRCLHVERGESSSGIIGLPYEIQCDCVDFVSEHAEKRAEDKKRQTKREEEILRRLSSP